MGGNQQNASKNCAKNMCQKRGSTNDPAECAGPMEGRGVNYVFVNELRQFSVKRT